MSVVSSTFVLIALPSAWVGESALVLFTQQSPS